MKEYHLKKILVVDDDLVIRYIFKKLFSNYLNSNVKIYTSSDGLQGLGYVYVVRPDLIIIDTTLPKYSGRELIEFISTNRTFDNTPIILLNEDEEKFHKLPSNYIQISKKGREFPNNLITELTKIFGSDLSQLNLSTFKYKLIKFLSRKILSYSNTSDISSRKASSGNILIKSFHYFNFLFDQFLTSIYLTIFYFLVGRKDLEETIAQKKKDLEKFRVKTFPAFAFGISIVLFAIVQFFTQTGIFAALSYLVTSPVYAATKTWTGLGIDNKWSTCANWNLSTCPAAGDTAVFDATSVKDITVDASFAGSIANININSGYTGTMTLNRSLTVSASFSQAAGNFNGTNQAISFGNVILTAGSFTSTSGILNVIGDLTFSGVASFNANAGTININGSNTQNLSCNNVTFNLITINKTSNNLLNLTNCSFPVGNNPTLAINTTGIVSLTLNSSIISGTGTLTLTTSAALVLNTGSSISGFSGLSSKGLTVSGVTTDFSSYSTFNLNGGSLSVLSSANLTLPNLAINVSTFTLTGSTFKSTSNILSILGDLTFSGLTTFNANGGTVNFNGTSTQNLSCNNVAFNLITVNRTSNTLLNLTNCNFPVGNNPTLAINTTSVSTLTLNNSIISGTGTLTLTTSATLILNVGSSISGFSGLSSAGLTVSGVTADFSSYSTFNLNGGSLSVLSSANLTLPNLPITIGSFTLTGSTFQSTSNTLNITYDIAISGTTPFNANGGTINIIGSGTRNLSCNNVTFNIVTINRTPTGNPMTLTNCNFPVGNNPTLVISSGGYSLILNSSIISGTGTLTLTPATALVLNTGSSISGFSGLSAAGLTVSGVTADFSSYSTFNLNVGALSVLSSANLTLPNLAISVGAFTLTGSTFKSTSNTLNIFYDMIISGTTPFNANGGTINFNGSGAQNVGCNNVSFNLITINRTSTGNSMTLTNCNFPVGNNPTLAITTGGYSLTLNNSTISGSSTLTLTPVVTLVLNAGSSISGFSGLSAAGLTVSGVTADFSSYSTFNLNTGSLSVLSSGNLTLPNLAISVGYFTLTGSTFKSTSNTLSITYDMTISGTTPFNANGGTVNIIGSSNQNLSCNNVTFNLVTINRTSNTLLNLTNCNFPVGSNPTLTTNTIGSVSLTLNNSILSGSGTLTLTTSALLVLNTGSSISGFTGLSSKGLTVSGVTADFSSYTTFNLNGGSLSVLSSGNLTLPNLAINIDFLTLTGSTFKSTSNTLTIDRDIAISGTTPFNANSGTINITGSTTQTLSCNNVTFNLVTFNRTGSGNTITSTNCNFPVGNSPTLTTNNGAGSTMTLTSSTLSGSGTLNFSGSATLVLNSGATLSGFSGLTTYALTISGATANFSTFTGITLASTFTISSGSFTAPNVMNVAGNFTKNGGTFTHNNGTVVLNGTNQTITGSNTFYNLTKQVITASPLTLTFVASTTQIIANNLVLKGYDATNRLLLRSGTNNVAWLVNPQASRDLLYLDVKDSNNINATAIQLSGTGSLNSGNNTNWGFVNTSPDNPTNLGPANVTSGTVAPNYTPTFTFNIIDTLNPLDTLNYQIQISKTNDYSDIAVDYTSALSTQGSKSFTIGQAAGTGTYTTGNIGQILTVGNYYWRVKSTDNSAAASSFTTANSGNIAFFLSGTPNNPTTLGSTAYVNGSFNTNTQPTLTFNITDPDVGDTVKYQIQISIASNYSSTVIDYTSALQAQGSASFTVGQVAGSGSYSAGTAGQLLPSGAYYWRVLSIDNNSLASGFTNANAGVAFNISAQPNSPTTLGPTNYIDGSIGTNTQPTLNFDISDPDISDTIKYQIQISAVSNFASTVVDYISSLQTQGSASFKVGQLAGSGTYSSGSSSQALASGNYYWRVLATDSHGFSSVYATANSGSIAFIVGGAPNLPINLGPTVVVNGSSNTQTQPTFNFDLYDTDFGNTISFNIQISTESDYSSTIVDYTSALQAQGSATFAIGQAAGSGAYADGELDQVLTSGSYYWRVKAIDSTGLQSSYTLANVGQIAFRITQTPNTPSNLGSENYVNGSSGIDTQPTLNFNISDPDVADSVNYRILISTINDYSEIIVDYTSTSQTQGSATFTVGQSGSYDIGNSGQQLATGNYYWKVLTTDENGFSSSYTSATSGSVAFVIVAPPNSPTALGSATLVDGSYGANLQPTFSFNLTDPDISDTLKYQIQISKVFDYSTLVVDYTSTLQSQGSANFIVGQNEGSGIYALGSASQNLASGDYYWRVLTIDSTGLQSTFTQANEGSIAFKITQAPNTPTNLGPTNFIDGGTGINVQPTFSFNLSDPDIGDTVKYQIQISKLSSFSIVIVSYTSTTQTPGAASFTVGQSQDDGNYSIGGAGQSLTTGNYYWRVSTIDNHSIQSAFSTANNGGIAFSISGIPDLPANLGPTSFVDGSINISTQPTLTFDLNDPDIGDTVKYQIQISQNSNFSSLTIDYISGLQDQGDASFTVGQIAASGSYGSGNSGQNLPSSSYYWRVRTIDQHNLASEYVQANNGIAFKTSLIPNIPTSLGASNLVDGSVTTSTTPEFNFTLSDPDSDNVQFIFQLSNVSDFSTLLINFKSTLTTQGIFNFTVGQSIGGTYTTGFGGQFLSNGTYYWKVKAVDSNLLESTFATANSGSAAFIVSAAPFAPSSLGPIYMLNATTRIETKPVFNFSISSPTITDLLRYQIQISTTSNYSSIVVDYTSDLQIQDIKQFTVGQAQGNGSYAIGAQDQNLISGSYYWRVKAINQYNLASSFTNANESIAFKISQKPNDPTNLGPTSVIDGSNLSNPTPLLNFTLTDPDATDTVKYQIQIADNNTFTSIVVDYTSTLFAQGIASFTIGQESEGGTYNIGSAGQNLPLGNYYWRVREIDDGLLTSDYSVASNDIAFIINSIPNIPTNLGLENLVDGSVDTNTQPTLSFDISDPDIGDTVKYQIQISTINNFSSAVVDYTSALQEQGAANFTIGQSDGTGMYNNGNDGQTLADGNYYWRVKAIDNRTGESAYAVANNGEVAFVIDTEQPTSIVTPTPSDNPTSFPTTIPQSPISPTVEITVTPSMEIISEPTVQPVIIPINSPAIVLSSFKKIENSIVRESSRSILLVGLTSVINLVAFPNVIIYALPIFKRVKKKNTWGIIYDEATKEPVPFVSINLLQNEKFIKQFVTGFDGRFGFIVNSGKYTLNVKHADYEEYNIDTRLNFNEGIIGVDIALKRKHYNPNILKRIQLIARKEISTINNYLFIIGSGFALISIFGEINIINLSIFTIFGLQVANNIRRRLASPNWSYVYDSKALKKLKGVPIRVYSLDSKQIDITFTDDKGRFTFNLPEGEYYLALNPDEYDFSIDLNPKLNIITSESGNKLLKISIRKDQNLSLKIALISIEKSYKDKFGMGI